MKSDADQSVMPSPATRPEDDPYSVGREERLPAQAGGGEFAPAPPDQTYQHALVRRLWEAQLGNLPDDIKRLMAEAATELEAHLPATDDFVNSMRRKHAKVIR
jgi:hypothetical protein